MFTIDFYNGLENESSPENVLEKYAVKGVKKWQCRLWCFEPCTVAYMCVCVSISFIYV